MDNGVLEAVYWVLRKKGYTDAADLVKTKARLEIGKNKKVPEERMKQLESAISMALDSTEEEEESESDSNSEESSEEA
jgi:hypothetical protein